MTRSFALVSPCGLGNLGDAAIQQAVIHHIRKRIPNTEIFGVTLAPHDTERRHLIPSFPIAAGAAQQYRTLGPQEYTENLDAQHNVQRAHNGFLFSAARRLAHLLLPRGWPWLIHAEVLHIVNAFKLLRGIDVLIFSGGGQLDDFWGGSWQHPYAMFKWALLARIAGARVVFLSVGFGSLASSSSRVLTRFALSLAHYRSYRDATSKELMRQAGFKKNDPVYPDLAYSLPECEPSHSPKENQNVGRTIAVSPIAYCDPRSWPVKDAEMFRSYLHRLAQVVAWLLRNDYRVLLVASDSPDLRVVDELKALTLSLTPNHKRSRLQVPMVSTVDEFLQQVASASMLVASRLHGVLLAHVAGIRALALSYERKVNTLMEDMEQTHYCLNIEGFQPAEFQQVFRSLEAEFGIIKQIRSRVQEYRKLLDRQYDLTLMNEEIIK